MDYEELTRGLTTKSEKIRTLGRNGVPTADIARFLGIRYQHARNVLNDVGLRHGGMAEEMPVLETKMMPPLDTAASVRQSVWVDVDAEGRLQIPADMMARAGLAGWLGATSRSRIRDRFRRRQRSCRSAPSRA